LGENTAKNTVQHGASIFRSFQPITELYKSPPATQAQHRNVFCCRGVPAVTAGFQHLCEDDMEDSIADDTLKGAEEISAFTGIPVRRVYALTKDNTFPHFRVGWSIWARKSTTLEWIRAQEESAR
jgi:hypothetical protein